MIETTQRRPYALFVFVLILSSLAPIAAAQSLDSLDAYVEKALIDWQVPGAAIGVVKVDALVYAKGFGVRVTGKPEKVDEHTVFAVASNTKAFTAALLGILVEEGKLGWDDRVVTRLGDFQLFDPWVTREIRVRDLLCHRSGLPIFGGDNLWIGSTMSRAEILRRIRYLEPTASFRARYQYNNIMFVAAGEIVPAVTGESWSGMLEKRIFEPLGMVESNASIRDMKSVGNLALPHEVVDGELKAVAFDDMDSTAPAGAINSNIVDMSKWMRLNLGGGVFEGERILGAGIVREMHSMQIAIPISKEREERLGTRFSGYGLGWGISDYSGEKLVTHGGGLSGMISYQALIPAKGVGVLVLTNRAPNDLARALVYQYLDALLGREQHDWSAVYLAVRDREIERKKAREENLLAKRDSDAPPTHNLAAYTGTYSSDLYGEAEVRLEEDRLVFDYNRRHRGPCEHWHHDTFRVAWSNPIFDMDRRSFLEFFSNEAGEVVELKVTFYQPVRFRKVRK